MMFVGSDDCLESVAFMPTCALYRDPPKNQILWVRLRQGCTMVHHLHSFGALGLLQRAQRYTMVDHCTFKKAKQIFQTLKYKSINVPARMFNTKTKLRSGLLPFYFSLRRKTSKTGSPDNLPSVWPTMASRKTCQLKAKMAMAVRPSSAVHTF